MRRLRNSPKQYLQPLIRSLVEIVSYAISRESPTPNECLNTAAMASTPSTDSSFQSTKLPFLIPTHNPVNKPPSRSIVLFPELKSNKKINNRYWRCDSSQLMPSNRATYVSSEDPAVQYFKNSQVPSIQCISFQSRPVIITQLLTSPFVIQVLLFPPLHFQLYIQ